MKIGNKIKEIRKYKNLSQDDLANKIYVSRQTISNWENDKTEPDIDSLKLLSKTFNIPLNELLSSNSINKKYSKLIGCFVIIFFLLLIGIIIYYCQNENKRVNILDSKTKKQVIAIATIKVLTPENSLKSSTILVKQLNYSKILEKAYPINNNLIIKSINDENTLYQTILLCNNLSDEECLISLNEYNNILINNIKKDSKKYNELYVAIIDKSSILKQVN